LNQKTSILKKFATNEYENAFLAELRLLLEVENDAKWRIGGTTHHQRAESFPGGLIPQKITRTILFRLSNYI